MAPARQSESPQRKRVISSSNLKESSKPSSNNTKKPRAIRALIVIDVQNDFIDGGLAVPDALEVIPVINRLRAKEFDYVYVCLDWHPYNHCSFRSNNPSKSVYEMVTLATMGGPQMMWPDHCIQGSHGAKLHRDIKVEDSDIYTVAGCNPRFDSYSVFRDNNLKTLAELRDSLEENKVTEIYAAGLATDYCVQYTVLDAKILTEAKVFVIEDGCKGIDPAGVKMAFKAFDYEKIQVVSSTGPEINAVPDRKLNIKGPESLLNRGMFTLHQKQSTRTQLMAGFGADTHTKPALTPSSKYASQLALAWLILGARDCPDAVVLDATVTLKAGTQAAARAATVGGKSNMGTTLELASVTAERARNVQALETFQNAARQAKKFGTLNRLFEPTGNNILHTAAQLNHAELVRYLLDIPQHNMDINATTSSGKTALMIAAQNGHLETARVLVKYAELDTSVLSTRGQLSALMYACRRGADPILTETLLHFDVKRGTISQQLGLRSLFGKTALMFACMRPSTSNAAIVELLVTAISDRSKRLKMLKLYDQEKWCPLHFAFKSGLFALVDWESILGGNEDVRRMPLNNLTRAGFSMLHLATFNNQLEVVRTVVEGYSHSLQNPFKERIAVNVLTPDGDTELDLAIRGDHIEIARHLIRLGCHARRCAPTNELLHRLVLMGDMTAAEGLLHHADENDITIDKGLVDITTQMEHAEACTFSFAGYSNPVMQYLYTCERCASRVCLVCKYTCHGLGRCRADLTPRDLLQNPQQDWTACGEVVAHCECSRDACAAMASADPREIEGYRFVPNPIRTDEVVVPGGYVELVKQVSENGHRVWGKSLLGMGWKFGHERNTEEKKHPLLLPYDQLKDDDKRFNIDMAVQTIKVILALGYELKRNQNNHLQFGNMPNFPEENGNSSNSLRISSSSTAWQSKKIIPVHDSESGVSLSLDTSDANDDNNSSNNNNDFINNNSSSNSNDLNNNNNNNNNNSNNNNNNNNNSNNNNNNKNINMIHPPPILPTVGIVRGAQSPSQRSLAHSGSATDAATSKLVQDSKTILHSGSPVKLAVAIPVTKAEQQQEQHQRVDPFRDFDIPTRHSQLSSDILNSDQSILSQSNENQSSLSESGSDGQTRDTNNPENKERDIKTRSQSFRIAKWDPKPIDTSRVVIPSHLQSLVGLIAGNSHEVWAYEKFRQGWRYAPERNIKPGLMLNSSLVPFSLLNDKEKSNLREGAVEKVKAVLELGWVIENADVEANLMRANSVREVDLDTKAGDTTEGIATKRFTSDPLKLSAHPNKMADSSESINKLQDPKSFSQTENNKSRDGLPLLTDRSKSSRRESHEVSSRVLDALASVNQLERMISPESYARRVKTFRQLKRMRRNLFNLYLFVAARRGHLHTLDLLFASMNPLARINVSDQFGHTPLYAAAKRGHVVVSEQLINLGAKIEARDSNGLTALAISAYLGNLNMCNVLLRFGANIFATDKLGYTPVHHAARQGNLDVCSLLADKLGQLHQGHVDLEQQRKDKNKNMQHSVVAGLRRASRDGQPGLGTTGSSTLQRLNSKLGMGRQSIFYNSNKADKYAMQVDERLEEVRIGDTLTSPTHSVGKKLKGMFSSVFTIRGNKSDVASNDGAAAGKSGEKIQLDHVIAGNADQNRNGHEKHGTFHRMRSLGMQSSRKMMQSSRMIATKSRTSEEIAALWRAGAKAAVEQARSGANESVITEFSPLCMAVMAQQVLVVELLIRHKANPMLDDVSGFSPYARALFHHIEATEHLVEVHERLRDHRDKHHASGGSRIIPDLRGGNQHHSTDTSVKKTVGSGDCEERVGEQDIDKNKQGGHNNDNGDGKGGLANVLKGATVSILLRSPSQGFSRARSLIQRGFTVKEHKSRVSGKERPASGVGKSKVAPTGTNGGASDDNDVFSSPIKQEEDKRSKLRAQETEPEIGEISPDENNETLRNGSFEEKSASESRNFAEKFQSARGREEALESAVSQKTRAVKMIEALSESTQVGSWRRSHALHRGIKHCAIIFGFSIAFASMVQSAPDYDLGAEFQWQSTMTSLVNNPAADTAFNTMHDVVPFLQELLIETALDDATNNDVVTLFKRNVVLGAMRLSRANAQPGACVESSIFSLAESSSQDKCIGISTSYSYESVDIPTHSVSDINQTLHKLLDTDWIGNNTVNCDLQMNAFNPYHEIHGYLQISAELSFLGGITVSAYAETIRVGYGRFPPSLTFQIAISVLFVLKIIPAVWRTLSSSLYCSRSATEHSSDAAVNGGNRKNRHKGAIGSKFLSMKNSLELATMLLLLGMLLLDIYIYHILLKKVRYTEQGLVKISTGKWVEDDESGDVNMEDSFTDLRELRLWLKTEREIFAIFLLVSMGSVFKYMRLLPRGGPVVVALMATMTHSSVLIYLLAAGVSVFFLSFSYFVAFATDVPSFSSFVPTFMQLIRMPFKEEWAALDTIKAGWLGPVAVVFYIIFATIIVNLFIAVVSDEYPKAQAKSKMQWETLVTERIEETLRNRVKDWSKLNSTLHIEYWDRAVILTGKDGMKHWITPHNSQVGRLISDKNLTTDVVVRAKEIKAATVSVAPSEAMERVGKLEEKLERIENLLVAFMKNANQGGAIGEAKVDVT